MRCAVDKKSMLNYFKPGIIHFMAFPQTMKGDSEDIEETVKAIVNDSYFHAVEISWIKDKKTAQKVKELVAQSGITMAYAAQPRLLTTGQNLNSLNEEERLQALENMKEGIDEAYEMNACGFAFLSGKYDEKKLSEHMDALKKSVLEMCRYAKSKGDMPILLEVFDYDVDKKSLIGPAKRAAEFACEMSNHTDNFGLLADLSHIPLLHETIEESLLPIKDYLKHVHIGNAVIKPECEAYGDAHPRFGFPNSENSVYELRAFLKCLFDIGFLKECPIEDRPIVSFEVKPWKDEDPFAVIASSKRTLDLAWSML